MCRNHSHNMASGDQFRDRIDDNGAPGVLQHSSDQPVSEDDLKQEMDHFLRVANAFLYYKEDAFNRVERSEGNYFNLPPHHRCMLPAQPQYFHSLKDAIRVNYQFIRKIVESAAGMFVNSGISCMGEYDVFAHVHPATGFDMEKVRTTLKQFYRDWSRQGEAERDSCYLPIIQEIKRLFPPESRAREDVSVLIPGAGLGRLAWEIAKLGYRCEGNEFSMFMLMASNLILNASLPVESVTIHPWVMRFSNNMSTAHQLAPVHIPDVSTSDLPAYGLFSMAAGDFLLVYTCEGAWDCVATCFFIDTANNVIGYLEKIYAILKPGGYWINLGPLLYHFDNMPGEFSIELAYEDIRRVAEKEIGFEFLKEDHGLPCSYIGDPQSMMQMSYKCTFSVARKPCTGEREEAAAHASKPR